MSLATDYKRLRRNATARLAARSVLFGAAISYTRLRGHHVDKEAVDAAIAAGAWAAIETFTPLNGIVGIFKNDVA